MFLILLKIVAEEGDSEADDVSCSVITISSSEIESVKDEDESKREAAIVQTEEKKELHFGGGNCTIKCENGTSSLNFIQAQLCAEKPRVFPRPKMSRPSQEDTFEVLSVGTELDRNRKSSESSSHSDMESVKDEDESKREAPKVQIGEKKELHGGSQRD